MLRASSPQGRFAEGAALLDGTVLEGTEAHGKHLLLRFAGDRAVHVHLGLYGSFRFGPAPAPPPRGALRLRLEGEREYADLRGPTACSLLTPEEWAAIGARLGPDPLRADADPERARARVTRSRSALAALLMDQSVVAGIGNVYRAEILFRARIQPYRPGRALEDLEWAALWSDLVTLMRAGVRAGRIITTRPEHRSRAAGRVRAEDAFYVYRRAGLPCRICGTVVLRELLLTRNLFWCPSCQSR